MRPSALTALIDATAKVAVGRSVTSTSVKPIVPLSPSRPLPPASLTAPVTSVALRSGTSLVPVTVTTKSWLTTAPSPSSMATV